MEVPPVQREGKKETKDKEPSLVLALAKTFGEVFVVAAVFKLIQDLLSFASPQILKYVSVHVHVRGQVCIYGKIQITIIIKCAITSNLN